MRWNMAFCREQVSISEAALSGFGSVSILGPLPQGHRNSVYLVVCADRRCVAKTTRRSEAELAWLADLMRQAELCGFRVPHFLPARDGRLVSNGWTLEPFLAGREVDPTAHLLSPALPHLHRTTADWKQRPGWVGLGDLANGQSGGDVDLSTLPHDVQAQCRAAWAALDASPCACIHGDLSRNNFRVGEDGTPILLDWDEARVDACFLDHVTWTAGMTPKERAAHLAWETACSWQIEPDHAKTCLRALRALTRKVGSLDG